MEKPATWPAHAAWTATYLAWKGPSEHDPELDESRFVDGLNHNLRTGDLVVSIVGCLR